MEFTCPFFTDSWCREKATQDVVSSKQGLLLRLVCFSHSCSAGFWIWGSASSGWIILAAVLDHFLPTPPQPCCSKVAFGASGARRNPAVLGPCAGGSKPHGKDCERWSLRRRRESMTDDATRTLGKGESSWQLPAGWGCRVGGCWLWRGDCLSLTRRPARRRGGSRFLHKKDTCKKKSVLSGAREAEARGSRGVLGRRVSPSAHRANPPPRTPSTRREHPPRAGPWRRNPPLQHEVLSLRAQDAPGPPGQRHQVSGGRPHRRAGTFTIWGAPLGCHRLSVTFFWDEVSERLAEGRWVPEWAILKCRIRSPQETVRTTRSKLNDGPGELGFFPKVCERGDRGGYGGLLRQLYEMQPRSHPRYIQVSSVPFIALTFPYLFFLHTLQPHFHCPSPNTPTHTHTHTLTLTVCLSHTHTNVCSWRQGLCLSYSWARREPGQ